MPIVSPVPMTNEDDGQHAETVALRALAWVACDERLGPRLLALTGLDAATLRARAGERRTLAAVIAFLEDHEPDLVQCAAALDMTPAAVVKAGRVLVSGVSGARSEEHTSELQYLM